MNDLGTNGHAVDSAIEVESAIFETAIGIGESEARRAFLDRSFHGDPEGLSRMEELLSLSGESAAFFLESQRERAELAEEVISELPIGDSPPVPTGRAVELPGNRIDGYLLIRRIGEGGSSLVYEAELERVKRKVALKILRLGMDTETIVSRFDAERQALERMDHPNIAKVLDAGTTPSGRPYFVMELVRGQRITSYCETEKLDVPARLGLFIQVCQAIQHAHQKGIIHRDIKPSNVLVACDDNIAVPKVIDFGIAKAIESSAQDRAALTALDQWIGTPAYMSPEQIDMTGIDVDTRTDVYSLGALLYELLSGRPPFDAEELMKSGMYEMRRTLIEREPPLPSEVLAANGGAMVGIAERDLEKLATALRGDLDWIVAKAMEKDCRRRYQTVNSLAMDLKRFLANEPVIARRPSRLYLMSKFFRRNRVACISGIAVSVSLVAGLSAATTLYFRERMALAEQERLKQVAETSSREESRLRGQAQARANISRVAILLSEGKVEDADRLLQQNPLESIDPSREAADVFRSLGGWNAVYGRWRQAQACFMLMNQATRLDDRVRKVESVDLLMTAPVYLELNDTAGYEAFRHDIVQRYFPPQNSLQAEHLLKACLLAPAGPELADELAEAAKVCEAGSPGATKTTPLLEWNALALSMQAYRAGDYTKALKWSNKCISYPDSSGTRIAAARCIAAMAQYHLGNTSEAASNLNTVRKIFEKVDNVSDDSRPQAPGNWFAWSVARILLREAVALTGD